MANIKKGVDYNAKNIDPDLILYYLANGLRTPQDEREERWLKSINETKAKGRGIEYPSN